MKRTKDKKKEEYELEVIERVRNMLNNNESVRDGAWIPKDIEILNKHLFLTAKPIIYLANIGDQ